MQQIGSIAAEVLANAKRAKEARDRLAGGLLGPAEIQDRPLSPDEGPRRANKVGVIAQGAGQHFTAEGVGGSDPVAAVSTGNGLEKGGHAAEKRKSTSNGCACPDPDETIGFTDRAEYTLRGLG